MRSLKQIILYFLLMPLLLFSCWGNENNTVSGLPGILEKNLYAINKLHSVNLNKNTGIVFPRSSSSGAIKYVKSNDWTSDFYPGILWLMYDLTRHESWKNQATIYTEKLESQKFNTSNHDIGFKMMCSYGNGLRLTNKKEYRDILLQSAKSLATRFDKNVGCIKSWDHHKDRWQYPVIIDNLMNLELLFTASKISGDPAYYNLAITHATNTLKNQMRENGSCFHVVDYDPVSGEVIEKCTYQGLADSSSWARGQAWALYGFTMIYRESGDIKFLRQAEKTATFILQNKALSDDYIPTWDFDAPANDPKDASAAAICASALYELSTFTTQYTLQYRDFADKIIASLASDKYMDTDNDKKFFLLKHSTGNKPKNDEIDTPIIYADYYFLESIVRRNKIKTN